jgi:hypothetical protein
MIAKSPNKCSHGERKPMSDLNLNEKPAACPPLADTPGSARCSFCGGEPHTLRECPACGLFDAAEHEMKRLNRLLRESKAEIMRLRGAIERALSDSESGTGWGPDVSVCSYLRDALSPNDKLRHGGEKEERS